VIKSGDCLGMRRFTRSGGGGWGGGGGVGGRGANK